MVRPWQTGTVDTSKLTPDVVSRRARQRESFVADIKAEARRQLAERGAGGVNWRGIATALGVNPASLYTYFDNLDSLITELLIDSYRDLATAVRIAVSAAAAAPAAQRISAGAHAYRSWALEHRAAFNLVFTDQVPGYAAPVDGPTTDAQIAVLRPIAIAFAELVGVEADELGEDGPVLETFLGVWGLIHGLTILEVNHHLDWTHTARLFDRQLSAYLDSLKIVRSSSQPVDARARRTPGTQSRTTKRR